MGFSYTTLAPLASLDDINNDNNNNNNNSNNNNNKTKLKMITKRIRSAR